MEIRKCNLVNTQIIVLAVNKIILLHKFKLAFKKEKKRLLVRSQLDLNLDLKANQPFVNYESLFYRVEFSILRPFKRINDAHAFSLCFHLGRERWGGGLAAPRKDSTEEHGLLVKIQFLQLMFKNMEKETGGIFPPELVKFPLIICCF